jgi:hypothetical protein
MALALLSLAAALPATAAFAQSTPFIIYDNSFLNGWQNRSWATVETPAMAGELKPLKVHGGPWSALSVHHDAFSTTPYSKLTFYIHGGAEGGQRLAVKAMADGKALDSSFVIEPKAKKWTIVEVPLKDLSAAGRSIEGLVMQAFDAAYKPYYITKIQFE